MVWGLLLLLLLLALLVLVLALALLVMVLRLLRLVLRRRRLLLLVLLLVRPVLRWRPLLLLLRPLLLLLLGGRRDFRDKARRAKPVDPRVRLEGPIQLPHGQGLVDLFGPYDVERHVPDLLPDDGVAALLEVGAHLGLDGVPIFI